MLRCIFFEVNETLYNHDVVRFHTTRAQRINRMPFC